MIQKGKRRAAKVLKRSRRRGNADNSGGEDPEGSLKEKAIRNRFKMLRLSVAKKWRDFDRISRVKPLNEEILLAAHGEADRVQKKTLEYGRRHGLLS